MTGDKRNTRLAERGEEREMAKEAGEYIRRIYNALTESYPYPEEDMSRELNRLCVRLIFFLYAEDVGLCPKGMLLNVVRSNPLSDTTGASVQSLLRNLYERRDFRGKGTEEVLENPAVLHTGEGVLVPRIDGEVRACIAEVAATEFRWSRISLPVLCGLFEGIQKPEIRRRGGMHYTSTENIHKVIDPLFLDGLRAELEGIIECQSGSDACRAKELEAYCQKLATLTFLDPACGSGNFLLETYISLRQLENEAVRHLIDITPFRNRGNIVSKVSIRQFYGIEINHSAAEVVETALWVAHIRMMKELPGDFHIRENCDFLRVGNYGNIRVGSALTLDWFENVPEHRVDYIIGNPPFSGARVMGKEQKAELLRVFEGVHGAGDSDYVACWFLRAAQLMRADPTVSTAFVATNSIVQGQSVAVLWKHLTERYGVYIEFAYRSFRWTGVAEASAEVHCVVVGMTTRKPDKCTLFDEQGNPHSATHINGYLVDATDIYIRKRSEPLGDAPKMGSGNKPIDDGNYLFTPEERDDFLRKEPGAAPYFRRWMGARELLRGEIRYCLWLGDADVAELKKLPLCTERAERVRAYRAASKSAPTRAIAGTPRRFHVENMPKIDYLAIPETSSNHRFYIPMTFCSADTLAGNALRIIPGASLYHFGVLTSAMHVAWMRAVAGRMGMGYRYSAEIVYNNFPWPEPTDTQRIQIEACAQDVLTARGGYPDKTLAELYDPDIMPAELRKAHEELDITVDAAYGHKFADEAARVKHLFALSH